MVLAAFEWKSPLKKPVILKPDNKNPFIELPDITKHEKKEEVKAKKPEPRISKLEITNDSDDTKDLDFDAGADQDKAIPDRPLPELEEEPSAPDPPFVLIPEVKPEFPGGMKALYEYLGDKIQFTEAARDMNIKGTVYVYFVVEDDGSLSNIDITRGLGYGLDEMVLEAVREMPKWKPGMQGVLKARVPVTIPVKFNLKEN